MKHVLLRPYLLITGMVAAAWLADAGAAPAPMIPGAEPYVWRNVVMGGGGFVDGLVFHPTAPDVFYARTDVGGAYRWDAPAHQWVPLTDWLSPAQNNYTGIESIALDPSDPNRLYLAAGTYHRSDAAILSSEDRGKTFKVTVVPFKMGGNEDGRSNGERLAVDPNSGAILYFGSRSAGLWRSNDRGVTWNVVASFTNTGVAPPAVAPPSRPGSRRRGWRAPDYGIVFVVFDPASGKAGSPTPVIYAAVATSGTNLYRSSDAGVTWQPLPGQPLDLRPSHLVISADGLVYLSYGSQPGPNRLTNGAIWKFNPRDSSWTNISPEKPADAAPPGWGYGAVCVDAKNPCTIMVTTIDRWKPKDEVFRSTNGGTTWKGILQGGTMDYSPAPYTKRMTPHWTGSLAVNPNNPDQVWFGTGYGVWCCTNAAQTDSGVRAGWTFADQGLEETVPLALLSPPVGAHLLSGVGDIDGFRHDDVNVSPSEGTFAGPGFNHTRQLAYAGLKPQIIVRLGNGGHSDVYAAISDDGGTTWQPLDDNPPGSTGGEGERIALAADGRVIVWTPRDEPPYFTSDRGSNWTQCQGLEAAAAVVADPVNPLRFYALAPDTGAIYTSTNAAATFAPTGATVPAMERFGGRGGGVFAATTDREGDLWAGSGDFGLFHSSDGGISFKKLDSVARADALGFGMAAPGKTFPALFLQGDVGQLHARFRSDDAGQTWVRIDDDQHQYGIADIPLIIGDPRIYGRVYFTTGGRGVIYGDRAR
jgi:photosystem II stability/assembly factor-like uncharacterized protein